MYLHIFVKFIFIYIMKFTYYIQLKYKLIHININCILYFINNLVVTKYF